MPGDRAETLYDQAIHIENPVNEGEVNGSFLFLYSITLQKVDRKFSTNGLDDYPALLNTI